MENFLSILDNFLFMIIVFMIAKLILDFLTKITSNNIQKAKTFEDKNKEQKIITSMTLLRSACRYIVYAVAILLCVNKIGYGKELSNAFMTAGIGALILSFGAQSFVKDLLAGLLLNFEHQYAVNDFVNINGIEGFVTAITFRVTYLNSKGKKIIITNGQVGTVINYSNNYNMASIEIPVAYNSDLKKVYKIINKIIEKHYKENVDFYLEKPEIKGISKLNESSIDILVVGKVKPLRQWETERIWRYNIIEEFAKNKITIPFKTITIEEKIVK